MLSKLSEGVWNIAVRRSTAGSILENQNECFELIPNSWRSWAADPFILERNGTVYVFAELFDYIKQRGRIGYTYWKNGRWQSWKVVIDEPFHMSYPNVFEYNGELYMVPETSADRTLRLYKAISFPDKWKLERILAENVAFVDTTFFGENSDICAITTDITDPTAHCDWLLRLDADWNLLSMEEIKEKRTVYSRCAGNILSWKDRKVRVSQNCDGHYGKALIFSEFQEENVVNGLGKILKQLSPWDIAVDKKKKWTGMHTYNTTQHYEVVDMERNHFTPVGFCGRLWNKARKMVKKV